MPIEIAFQFVACEVKRNPHTGLFSTNYRMQRAIRYA